jgi:hypothetical protein
VRPYYTSISIARRCLRTWGAPTLAGLVLALLLWAFLVGWNALGPE